jgi:predicted ATP-grasp superfamily ATP-dependent carboligase
MSASFLVDGRGTAWLLGVGIQRIAIRDGRFAYQGGTLPAPSRAAAPLLQPALAAIPGLRGFVGVDFVWDPPAERATVLEINPRATTSCVGLTQLLPPGRLAEAWLRVFEPQPADATWFGGLAELIHGGRPVGFDARGDPVPDLDGVFE